MKSTRKLRGARHTLRASITPTSTTPTGLGSYRTYDGGICWVCRGCRTGQWRRLGTEYRVPAIMMCLVVGGVVCKPRFLLSSLLLLERGKEEKNRVVGRSGTCKAGRGYERCSPTLKAKGEGPWGVNGRRVGAEVLVETEGASVVRQPWNPTGDGQEIVTESQPHGTD